MNLEKWVLAASCSWVKPDASIRVKATIMKKWYRKELKQQLPQLIEKWEKVIGVKCIVELTEDMPWV